MKIIILGAGRVGESVAESLVSERNDITMIDHDGDRLRALEDRFDLQGVVGNGAHPSILKAAGIEDADMMIACSASDETNLVVCKVAHDVFGTPTTIARLRSPEYQDSPELLSRTGFAVDHVICPEESVMKYILQLIQYPEALQIIHFSQGRASMVVVRAVAGSALVGKALGEFKTLLPSAEMRVVAIYRNGFEVPSNSDARVMANDEVFVLAEKNKIRSVLFGLHKQDQPVQRIMIAGGGRVGLRLARGLVGHYQVKIIEQDKARCEYLAEQLPADTLVLRGDVADADLLQEENVGEMDLFLSLTNDDEDNILSAMLAKRMGAKRVMALINRRAYADMMEGSTIDIAISPAQTIIGELLAHLRKGDVAAVHSLRRGAAEVLEGVARGDAKTSKLVGRRIEELKLPRGASIGAIIRGDGDDTAMHMPHHDTLIETGDHVVVFIPNKRSVRDVEKLFQVSATFFG